MTAASQTLNLPLPRQLRPLNLRRDLKAVADLVELCFADNLDADGRRYVSQMRAAARTGRLLGWAANAADGAPLSGFVWEEEGKLVGNLNTMPVTAMGERASLIANVAVHPDYRKRGIARALTGAALDSLRRRGVRSAWLQVSADNPAALALYEGLGFEERAVRTTWHSQKVPGELPLAIRHLAFAPRRAAEWDWQRDLLQKTYPPEVAWHLPFSLRLYKPGWRGALTRAFSDRDIRQWSAWEGKDYLGSVIWQTSFAQADWLWLAVNPEREAQAIEALLTYAHRQVGPHRALALDYPAGQSVEALRAAGFTPHHTLIWMHTQP